MREIIFRAWDKNIKTMIYADPHILYSWGLATSGNIIDMFEDEDIMQYTGLKDKNGKEIYEGDILQSIVLSNNEKILKEVFYDKELARFAIHHLPKINMPNYCGLRMDWLLEFNYEVIGNIYENPELLKGKYEG